MGREGSQAQWLTSWRVEVGGRRIEANPRAASFTYKIPNQPEFYLENLPQNKRDWGDGSIDEVSHTPCTQSKPVLSLVPGKQRKKEPLGFLAIQSNYGFKKIPDVNCWPSCAHTHSRIHISTIPKQTKTKTKSQKLGRGAEKLHST